MSGRILSSIVIGTLLTLTCGCRSVAPFPIVNLKEDGWTVHEGQAVWRLKGRNREFAGEILLATNSDGRTYVQFSKMPFPVLVAQSGKDSWEVTVPTRKKRYSGQGEPPVRFIWLYLPRVVSGQPPPKGWSWQKPTDHSWRLEKHATGECIEGYFDR